ncbi:MAG: hypothetical protein U0Z70_11380 [Thermomicrobiales bacterium]
MSSRDHMAPEGMTELAHPDPGGPPAGTRRALLCAASGVALAAGGVLVPRGPGQADAREGALHGTKGGRRGKNRRGRHRKRTHGDRKSRQNDQRPRGSGPTQNIAFTVRNFRSVAVQMQGWEPNQANDAYVVPTGWDWTTLAALPAAGPAQPTTKELVGDSYQLIVRIGTNRLVWALNHGPRPFRNGELPDVLIGVGGWDAKGWNPRGVARTESDPLDSGRSISADGIKVTRIDDSPTHLRFTIDLT